MNVIFYTNSSPPNHMQKVITEVITTDCDLKEITDIVNPIIEVIGVSPTAVNYVKIPQFNRFYFIRDYETTQFNTIKFYLHCDVLMSFQSQILSNQVLVTQSESDYHSYLHQNVPTLVKPKIVTRRFNGSFSPKQQSFVLTCLGG